MADYRLSAKVISRGKGQSAIASAAYRAATRLHDERTGQTADYSRKAGVIHAEVLAPEGTPDWMHDREQLWNAVEAVERRKDAQLAREVQLSLPHELTDQQRRELVRTFVQEQFVAHGMIADLAIHAPSGKGDDRNHHAHVMLTMRELTGDGFGNKARAWNSSDQLEHWREQWAHHQNRALERHGHAARVDHRSFEDRGIDREPSQHLGPTAHDMEAKGKASRIGDENREAARRNADRARDYMEAARLASDRARFEGWAQSKQAELESAQDLARLDLSQKHHREKLRLETRLHEENHTAKVTIAAELEAVDRRLKVSGFRKLLRNVFGRTSTDEQHRQNLAATLANIGMREAERRQALESTQEAERAKEAQRQADNRDRLRKGIETARERRDGTGRGVPPKAAEKPSKPPSKRRQTPKDPSLELKPSRSPRTITPPVRQFAKSSDSEPPPPEVKPIGAPSLDDLKRMPGDRLSDLKDALKAPWDSTSHFSNDNDRAPWDSDLSRSNEGGGRERSPRPPMPPSKK